MNKEEIKKAIEELKKNSVKRKFDQTIEIIVNFKDLNLKRPENQLNYFIQYPNSFVKKLKICAFVGPELEDEAKKNCDQAITVKEFIEFKKNPKKIKKLANKYDFFIAQANLMADIAKVFGRFLGARGKMPNPKAGCVVPPKATLKPLIEKLKQTINIKVVKQPVFQSILGKESQDTKVLVENALSLYDSLIHHLPGETNNLKSIYIKLTMSKPIKVY